MQNFGSRLLINPASLAEGAAANSWAGAVYNVLHQLYASATGRCLINFINSGKVVVSIRPYLDTKARKNAFASAVDWQAATYRGRPLRDGAKGDYLGPARQTGTGTGSSVNIYYTPWRWTAAGNRTATLLHEMVHAAQQGFGVSYTNPLSFGFDTQAEFDAIMVENIYRSETGETLRRNHRGWEKLQGMMVPRAAGYDKLINSFRARTPRLAHGLAEVHAAFNPFRPGAEGYVAPPGH